MQLLLWLVKASWTVSGLDGMLMNFVVDFHGSEILLVDSEKGKNGEVGQKNWKRFGFGVM